MRVPRTLLNLTQRPVVVNRVLPHAKPFLDGGELGGQDLIAAEDQRLQGTRHPPVAVTPWVYRDEVEVRHGRSDVARHVQVSAVEPLHQLVHQRRDGFGVGPLVDDLPGRRVADVDPARARRPRGLVVVMADHHEVQRVQHAGVEAERPGQGEVPDVGERLLVAGDLTGHRRGGLQRLLAEHDRLDVLHARAVSLDGVGALDRPRPELAPELAVPPMGLREAVLQIAAHVLDLAENGLVGRVQLRCPVQHAVMTAWTNHPVKRQDDSSIFVGAGLAAPGRVRRRRSPPPSPGSARWRAPRARRSPRGR